jgi:hypothetical protein
MPNTFKIGEEEFPIVAPRGRKGRKATNYLMAKLGSGTDADDIFELLSDEHFELHLPVLLGVDEKFLEENGTSFEIMSAVFSVINEMNQAFDMPEVDAALKNSEDTQAAAEE